MATATGRGSGTPVTSGTTWATVTNAVDGAVGTSPNTYATWVNNVSSGTGYIEIANYPFTAALGASDTINSVTVSLRHLVSNTSRISNVNVRGYVGATPVGSAQANSGTNTTVQNYSLSLTGLTAADLRDANFKLRITATRSAVTQSTTWSIDHADITVDYTAPVPSITQAAYRFYDDTGTEATSPPLQAQDTAHTGNLTTGDGTGQFRVRLQSTTANAVPATDDFRLEWEKNASGTWNAVPSGAVIGYDSPTLTEAGATTNRLTGGTGTFVAGKIAEDGVVDNLGWAGNNFTELVFSVKLVAAQLVNGDTIRFRVVKNGATTDMTYAVVPTISLTVDPQTWSGSAGGVGVAGTSGSFSESVWTGPIPETGLVGWWDADDAATITASGGAVSQWTDKSGGARQAVQATGTLKPTTGTRTINGRNALDFNDDMLGYLPITLTQPITLFIVVQADFTDALNRQIIGNWGTNPTVYAVGQTWNIWNGSNLDSLVAVNLSPHYLRAVFDGASSGLWIDGTTAITGTLPTTGWSAQTFGIGAGDNVTVPGYFWDGLIAEVIAYNRVLTAPEIADVESYLSTKWIPAVVPGGKPKVWTGSVWAEKPIKVWTGSAWVEKPLKVWTGSSWVLA